jgi:hypothetical protein
VFHLIYVMPRVNKRKTDPTNRDHIEECIQYMISSGVNLNAASKEYAIPEATLRRHKKKSTEGVTIGVHGTLAWVPLELQKEIASVARMSAYHGFGFTKKELQSFIGEFLKNNATTERELGRYLQQHCRFKDFYPSSDWIGAFIKNHRLSLKIPSNTERSRIEAASDLSTVNHFYDLLEEEVSRLGLTNSANHIYNLDESSFFTDPRRVKVVAERGAKCIRVTSGSGRNCFTALACINAAGFSLAPLVIFSGKNLHSTWKAQKPLCGTTYACSGEY